jgi:membrane protein required for colicin V production
MQDFTSFDCVVIAILVVSTLFATAKGFIRSFFSLFNFLIALVASYYFSPIVMHILKPYTGGGMIAQAIISTVIYILVLSLLSGITRKIRRYLSEIHGGMLDAILGFVFGFLRGMIFVMIIFLFIISTLSMVGMVGDKSPDWLAKSKTYPYLQKVKKMLSISVPDSISKQAGELIEKAQDKINTPSDDNKNIGNKLNNIKGLIDNLPPDIKQNIDPKTLHNLDSSNTNPADQLQMLKELESTYRKAMDDKFISSGENENAQNLIKALKGILSQDMGFNNPDVK